MARFQNPLSLLLRPSVCCFGLYDLNYYTIIDLHRGLSKQWSGFLFFVKLFPGISTMQSFPTNNSHIFSLNIYVFMGLNFYYHKIRSPSVSTKHLEVPWIFSLPLHFLNWHVIHFNSCSLKPDAPMSLEMIILGWDGEHWSSNRASTLSCWIISFGIWRWNFKIVCAFSN